MKKLMPFLFLATLVSCVDTLPTRSTLPRLIRDISNLDSGSTSSLKQGAIIRTHKTGLTMNPVVLNADNTLEQHDLNTEIIAVVLKVTGNNYYEYQEIHDYAANKVSKQVILKAIPTKELYADAFVSNDIARQNGTSQSTLTPSEKVKVKFKQDVVKEINLKSIMCDITVTNEEFAVVLVDGKALVTDYTSNSEKTNCDGILSSQEFQNIDLSSIQFCDYTSKDVECGQYNLNNLKK